MNFEAFFATFLGYFFVPCNHVLGVNPRFGVLSFNMYSVFILTNIRPRLELRILLKKCLYLYLSYETKDFKSLNLGLKLKIFTIKLKSPQNIFVPIPFVVNRGS